MGYAHGQNNNGREIGYGVEATCDLDGCDERIDRGIAHCCGGVEGVGNAGMDDEAYCGGFFCGSHLLFVPSLGQYGAGLMVCPGCFERATCPDCNGVGAPSSADAEDCETCDTHGVVTKGYVDGKGVVPV